MRGAAKSESLRRETSAPQTVGEGKNSMSTEPESTQEDQPAYKAPHYTIAELAALWKFSIRTLRQEFDREPGVLAKGHNKSKGARRRYRSLRIPEGVAERVYRRLLQRG